MRRRTAAIDVYVAAIVIAGVLGLAAWALPSTPNVRDWGVLVAVALQSVLPQLAVTFLAVQNRSDAAPVRQPLRVVASR